jgi:hypothetical protein
MQVKTAVSLAALLIVTIVPPGTLALVKGETGRLQDWKNCCYYYCHGKEREMERCGSSQGLDIGVAAGG